MDFLMIFKAVLALAFVLGLLLLTLWALKYCHANMPKKSWFKNLQDTSRLRIVESKKIDIRNSLVLVEKDGVEHLLLLGQGSSLLIESKEVKK